MSIVAYSGEIEFDGASWSDLDGWRVRFRVIQLPGDATKSNPFKQFTKRSGDRPGTRFVASLQPVAYGKPFEGEVALAAWSDSTRGWTVSFSFAEEPVSFAGCIRRSKDTPGTRFMGALVEIDHDETVINQEQREKVERDMTAGRIADKKLSGTAAILGKNQQFWEWLRETVNEGEWKETTATRWIKDYCAIKSRAELDDQRNTLAIGRFVKLHSQFREWLGDTFYGNI
jgi:hypothetical protein